MYRCALKILRSVLFWNVSMMLALVGLVQLIVGCRRITRVVTVPEAQYLTQCREIRYCLFMHLLTDRLYNISTTACLKPGILEARHGLRGGVTNS